MNPRHGTKTDLHLKVLGASSKGRQDGQKKEEAEEESKIVVCGRVGVMRRPR